MAGGGGGGALWVGALVGGGILTGIAYGLEAAGVHAPEALLATLLAAGGLAVVFGSCEAMIQAVENLGRILGWNHFVAGTIAGVASNIPEVVMVGFVVAKEPRVAFVVVLLTIHVGALAFGVYSGLLPRDARGLARLPAPLTQLSTDLYACASGVFCAMGGLMLVLKVTDAGDARGEGLLAGDLLALGAALLLVFAVNIVRLVKRFSGATDAGESAEGVPPASEGEPRAEGAEPEAGGGAAPASAPDAAPAGRWSKVLGYGALGVAASVLGGHAVGEFADALVKALTARGYSEMIGALLLSVFACAGVFIMIATAHAKGLYDIAIANVSGAVTQQPFLVLPVTLILMAVFAQVGVIEPLPHGGILAIDFETTSVVFFAFPVLLMLWKSVNDDGRVNWLETASMIALFGLVIFFLAEHGPPANGVPLPGPGGAAGD
ncbi:MAG: hypothetical protein D6731_25435 [Planctomycetota bacterium]|nr:MAG: hypothetical protein D6731_25435 [Planctomycetota bacterium]